jgi:hypothetical protein
VREFPRTHQPQEKLGLQTMNLPKLDISSLPDLETVTGLFGSLVDAARVQSSDDTIVFLITFLYEIDPTRGIL